MEPAVGGDSLLSARVAATDVAGAVIKLCLHLSLSLISWRGASAAAAGCPRFTDPAPPPRLSTGGALLTPCGRDPVVQRNAHKVL